ncbi:hypothetical protein [Vulcanimicrobium alpinum]|nr:hypothetical protein [Vulcanimicrobium alpinum]
MSATVPPKAPTYPVPVKPDFSSMKFLLGTWKCATHSERRGNEASLATITYTMAPDGYFMKSLTKSQKVSYAAVGYTATDWYTYDNDAKRWIDVTVGSSGAYGYSTSMGWQNSYMLWGADSFLPNGDVTSSTGTLMTKISDTKYTTKQAFTTAAGLLNRVTGSCAKQ